MSTKTNFKRIALVAVTALGAGVLSVAPANATDGVFVTAGIRVNGTAIVKAASTANTQTLTIGANSSVTVTAVAGTDVQAAFTVSGGTITASTLAPDTSAGTSTPTTFVYGNTTPDVTFTPNAGESRMVITSWLNTANRAAGTPAAATLTVTIKSGAVGVVSPGDSFVKVVAAGTTTTPTDNVDVAAARSVADGTNGRINFDLYDANGVALSTSAVVTTTSSAGCLVGTTDAASSFLSNSVSATIATADEVFVARAVSKAPATCTLTMSVNGVALGTKTITLQGKITRVEVDGGQAGIKNAFASNSTSESVFSYSAYDAAGNAATGLTITNTSTASAAFSSVTTTDTTNPVDGAYGDVTCSGAARGSGTFNLAYVNSAGETIKSPTYTVNCFGNAVTYTASLDKASYVPGDIATLTITAKDASGNPANDYVYLGGTLTGTGTTLAPSIAGSNMTAITAPTSTDLFSAGKKTYKFVVGSTEGSYQLAIDLPKFNSTTYSQAAITVAYKIAASSATVTNADVLKSIVSLIASINKQIAALQKALLRR
jgi:trimeric autotransporter adhesin